MTAAEYFILNELNAGATLYIGEDTRAWTLRDGKRHAVSFTAAKRLAESGGLKQVSTHGWVGASPASSH